MGWPGIGVHAGTPRLHSNYKFKMQINPNFLMLLMYFVTLGDGRTVGDEPYKFHASSQMVRNSLLCKTFNITQQLETTSILSNTKF